MKLTEQQLTRERAAEILIRNFGFTAKEAPNDTYFCVPLELRNKSFFYIDADVYRSTLLLDRDGIVIRYTVCVGYMQLYRAQAERIYTEEDVLRSHYQMIKILKSEIKNHADMIFDLKSKKSADGAEIGGAA